MNKYFCHSDFRHCSAVKICLSLFLCCLLFSVFLSSCKWMEFFPENQEKKPLLEAEKIVGFESAKKELPEKLQENYEILDDAVYRLEEEVKFRNLHQDDVRTLIEYYKADHPEVFWLDAEYGYSFNTITQKISEVRFQYSYFQGANEQEISFDPELIKEMSQKIKEETATILSGITAEMSDYEKVKYFHDYLASSVSYDTEADFQHTIYGALVEKKAVCDGLSCAFQYLCQKVGIEAVMVYGSSSDGVSHAWNIVRLGEEYYHVDITWDMPEQQGGDPFYLNFLIDDSKALENHVMFSPQKGKTPGSYSFYPSVPVCTSLQYWYYLYENLLVKDYGDLQLEGICSMLANRIEREEESIQLLFYSRKDYQNFLEEARMQGNDLQSFLQEYGIDSYQIAVNEEHCLVILKPGYSVSNG